MKLKTIEERVNVADIPSFLGTTLEERLHKYLAYRQGGIILAER